ncbi:MAG: PQQ-dependent sugar dehydrogenase [Polyangiaceae bacterium]
MRAWFVVGAAALGALVTTACGDDSSGGGGTGGTAGTAGNGGASGASGSAGNGGAAGNGGSAGSAGNGGTSGSAGNGGTGGIVTNTCTGTAPPSVTLTEVASGLNGPMEMIGDPQDATRMFIIERDGRVLVKNGGAAPKEVLDITDKVSASGEGGLLGIALHPHFGQSGERRFYVSYTESGSPLTSVIAEYQISANDPDVADTAENRLYTIDQPATNHDGGDLAFGSDGYLYAAFGDGGGGNDQYKNGQDPSTPLGAILRFDVENHPTPPPDNHPSQEYVYHWGVRNPYRISFDRANGDLYFGDVGQDTWEEVNAVKADSGRHNFGWNIMEGMHCRGGGMSCDQTGLTLPLTEYSHSGQGDLSVTGGVVYRGTKIPGLYGRYIYSDFFLAQLQTLVFTGTETCDEYALTTGGESLGGVVAFGEDKDGEVYVVSLYNGNILRLDP